jgi:ABC-type transport system substrate-binding protein
VKFHDGSPFTPEDVAGSFSAAHMFGDSRPTVRGQTMRETMEGVFKQRMG